MNLSEAIILAEEEYNRVTKKFPPFRSTHEGIAIIEEEFLELRQEVFTKSTTSKEYTDLRIRKEAVQVAAMALRFLVDCC
jgi:hypothetical protein